jgi:hypothetical protein
MLKNLKDKIISNLEAKASCDCDSTTNCCPPNEEAKSKCCESTETCCTPKEKSESSCCDTDNNCC